MNLYNYMYDLDLLTMKGFVVIYKTHIFAK